MPQSSLWGSSERAERGPQDVGRRRQDLAAATRRMLEAAGLKPGVTSLTLRPAPGIRVSWRHDEWDRAAPFWQPTVLRTCWA
jgi:hypothetical protein